MQVSTILMNKKANKAKKNTKYKTRHHWGVHYMDTPCNGRGPGDGGSHGYQGGAGKSGGQGRAGVDSVGSQNGANSVGSRNRAGS